MQWGYFLQLSTATYSLIILVLAVSSPALSQLISSAMQTVTFAVNRSTKPALNILAKIQSASASSNASDTIALEKQLKQQSTKVTISTSNSNYLSDNAKRLDIISESATATSTYAASMNIYSDIHLDLSSVLETEESIVNNSAPLVITITD